MLEHRRIVELASTAGTRTYGLTTGVGMRRDADVGADDARAFNRSAILGHLVGLGPPAREEVVRAALLCHANALAAGYQGARPEVAAAYRAGVERGRRTARQLTRDGRPVGPRTERGPRARGAGRPRARGRRGACAVERQRVLDGTGCPRDRRRPLVARVGRCGRGTRLRGVPRKRRRPPSRDRAGPTIDGGRRHADPRQRAARGERALRRQRSALPPGPAQLPLRPAGARCRARRARLRGESGRRRAQLAPGQPAGHCGRAAARLGRELRLAGARNRTRSRTSRACARAHRRRRAHAEAPEPAVQRPDRGSRRGRGIVAGRALRARRRRAGDRRRGAAARAARLDRARLDDAGVRGRGPDFAELARRPPARRAARPGRATPRDRARGRRAGDRPSRRARARRRRSRAHAFVRERVEYLDAPERMPLPLEELAGTIRRDTTPA